MTDEKKNPLGPTGARVHENVTRMREARGLAKKDLAAKTAAVGRPIPPLGISRIEAGTRRIDADDLVALALALNVSPASLLMPEEADSRTTVHLTDEVAAKAADAWKWASGEATLPELWEPRDPQRQEDYERLSVPAAERRRRQQPAARAADALRDDIYRLLEYAGHASAAPGMEEEGEYQRRLTLAKETLGRLNNEINRIEAEHADLVAVAKRTQAKWKETDGPGLD